MGFSKKIRSKLSVYWVIGLLIIINILATQWHSRIDFTSEKRFTLSTPTKKILKQIKQPLVIDVLLKGNYPSGFKKLASSCDDILNEYKEIAGNNLQINFVSPDEKIEGTNSIYSDTMSGLECFPINLTLQVKDGQQQQYIYPFALLRYENKFIPIELYKGKTPLISNQELNSSEAMLEYQFSNAIAAALQKEKPLLGYSIGNGEPVDITAYDLAEKVLKPSYDVSLININKQPVINPDFKALLIVKPTFSFSDYEKLKIDQYIMQGGKVLFFIDRLNAELDSLKIKNQVVAYDRDLKLDDLLFKYGVRINPNLVMDLQCDYLPFDVNGNGQFEFLPWNYFLVIESANNHPINKNLGYVSGKFVNSIDTIESEGIQKTVLLQSSVNARVIGSPAIISGSENSTLPEDEKYRSSAIPMAVLIEGKFNSFFKNRLTLTLRDSLQQYGQSFKPLCLNNNKLLVVSDGDIVLNAVVKGNQPLPIGMNPFTYGSQREFPFANKDFLMNTLDYMINENGLGEAKSKDYVVRLLDTKKVEEEKSTWQFINIALPILIVIVFAYIFQWYRKRKYTI